MVGLFAFIPQLAALISISIKFGRDIPFCTFLLTMVFVTFNKVCTAQYFVWYTSILPLVLPSCHLSGIQYVIMIIAWFASELHWLYWAYFLEMEGLNTFFEIWIAGIIFFMVNVGIICAFIRNNASYPIFVNGNLQPIK